MTDKTANYTDAQLAQAVQAYKDGQTIESIAHTLGKSTRSVVAKLAREGVYVAKAKATATRVTKAMLIAVIADKTGVSTETLATLEKANHEALEALADVLPGKIYT